MGMRGSMMTCDVALRSSQTGLSLDGACDFHECTSGKSVNCSLFFSCLIVYFDFTFLWILHIWIYMLLD